MEITKDRLHLLAGISALAFGIYCAGLGISMAILGIPDMDVYLLVSCIIFTIIYIIYGIFLFLAVGRGRNSFIGIGLVVTMWLPSGFDWYVWPLFIMPFVILGLGLLIVWKQMKGGLGNG